MQDASVLQTPPVPLVAGTYTVTLNCSDRLLNVLATYTGSLIFTSPTEYRTDPPVRPVTTTTALAVTPDSPAAAGTVETLTATVSPSGAKGNVQFTDGGNPLGSPVPAAHGIAVTTTTLAVGTHQLIAVFTPTDAAVFGPSTSPVVTFVVSPVPPRDTTTTLSVFPAGPFPAGTPRLLLARVAPDAAAGRVQFLDGDRRLGAPVRVRGGSAFLVTDRAGGPRLSAGTHSLTAVFTPANPAAFGPSTSPAVVVEVTPRIREREQQPITTGAEQLIKSELDRLQ